MRQAARSRSHTSHWGSGRCHLPCRDAGSPGKDSRLSRRRHPQRTQRRPGTRWTLPRELLFNDATFPSVPHRLVLCCRNVATGQQPHTAISELGTVRKGRRTSEGRQAALLTLRERESQAQTSCILTRPSPDEVQVQANTQHPRPPMGARCSQDPRRGDQLVVSDSVGFQESKSCLYSQPRV